MDPNSNGLVITITGYAFELFTNNNDEPTHEHRRSLLTHTKKANFVL